MTDRGYLRIQKKWRRTAARRITCPLVQVESDVIVPVEVVSDKAEYAARTIRPSRAPPRPRHRRRLTRRRPHRRPPSPRSDSRARALPAGRGRIAGRGAADPGTGDHDRSGRLALALAPARRRPGAGRARAAGGVLRARPGRRGPLGEGQIDGRWLICPWHGYEYRVRAREPTWTISPTIS